MKTTKHHKNVHAIECGRTQEFLLLSDLHWDNPKCDRALLTNHLEEAKRRGAGVLVNGDFFCLMQGKGDPRRSKDDIRSCNFITHYYHGSGGGGPVTKGVIQDQRILASIEGYDCTWQGHVHELYYHQNIIHRYDRSTKTLIQKAIHQVRTATYKEEWAGGYMGFHVERGRGPKPLGGYWMTLEAGRFTGKDRRGPELQVFASFAPCDRFYTAGS